MPRFAFALPILPGVWDEWHDAATGVATYHSRGHREFLLSRGIFREKVWLQRGEATEDLTLFLWDLDDVDKATSLRPERMTEHEQWMRANVLARYHDLRPNDLGFPMVEVLSGTTLQATAASATQTMFALPIPQGGEPAVRALIERVELGDLSRPHQDFLADHQIHEEWIWLQSATSRLPAQLLVHWIGDDVQGIWEGLQHSDAVYARALRDTLFLRLSGIDPSVVGSWEHEQVLNMHVRRSDGRGSRLGRRTLRAIGALVAGRPDELVAEMADHVGGTDVDGGFLRGPDDVLAAIADATQPFGPRAAIHDVMAGESRVVVLLGPRGADVDDPPLVCLLLRHDGEKIVGVDLRRFAPVGLPVAWPA